MITLAQHAEIRRLFFAEHWRLGTIVAQLGVHLDTVRAAVNCEASGQSRASMKGSGTVRKIKRYTLRR